MAPPGSTPRKRANKAGKNRSSQTENPVGSVPRHSSSGPPGEPPPSCTVKAPSQTQTEGSPKKVPKGSPVSGEKLKESRRRSASRKKRHSGKGSTPGTLRQSQESPSKGSEVPEEQPSTQGTTLQKVSQTTSSGSQTSSATEKAVKTPSCAANKSASSEKAIEEAKFIKIKAPSTCLSSSEFQKAKMSDNKLNDLCQLLETIVLQHGDAVKAAPQTKVTVNTSSAPAMNSGPSQDVSKVDGSTEGPDKDGEQSREEVEKLRKARKEAKKAAKKKGGEPDKAKEGTDESRKENDKQNQKEVKAPNNTIVGTAAPSQQPKQGSTAVAEQQKEAPADGTGKSKADLKRERREKQEAQRQAKALLKAQQEAEKQKKNQAQTQKIVSEEEKKPAQPKKKRVKKNVEEDNARRIPLLGHLTPYMSSIPSPPVNCDTIHPAIRTLGQKMKDRVVDGSTARVIATLSALKRFISDYRTPESCDLSRDLAEKMRPNVAYLHACRPLAIAMDNAVRFLKHKVNSIAPNVPEAQAKDLLRTAIDEYVQENINLASSTIATHASQLLQDGDVILTFGYSALVCDMIEAFNNGSSVNVSVVVADSPYPPSGADMAKRLAAMGVTTYYRLITDVNHIMHKVTKVVVEAEAVMMNGAVQGVCGTAGLALVAATHDTPFIVLCHTYKFSNNDLTDSLVVNELGDANGIVCCPSRQYCDLLAGWQETDNLNVVSLVYDVTPASLVTVLVTEQSVLPTSSVPVIIRRNYADILGQD